MTFQPIQKFVTHKDMHEGWTYISIPDDNLIIGVKIAVTKVMKLYQPDGKTPMLDPEGRPAYGFQSTNVVKVLTREEFDLIKKSGLTE